MVSVQVLQVATGAQAAFLWQPSFGMLNFGSLKHFFFTGAQTGSQTATGAAQGVAQDFLWHAEASEAEKASRAAAAKPMINRRMGSFSERW